MTGESKILTVSYGTFSCTLEGFDDPFNTMKAVAEYFRDLAAEDRYFGSEPPVPDTAMLHRIAEREVQRMVEARVQNHGVFLRQRDGGGAAQPVAPQAPLPPTVDPAPPAALADPASPDLDGKQRLAKMAQDGFSADAVEDEALPILHDMIPGGVAAKLARIRQSVNATPVVPILTPETLAAFAVPPEVNQGEQGPGFDQTADIELTAMDLTEAQSVPATVDTEHAPVPAEAAEPDSAAVDDALSRLLAEDENDLPHSEVTQAVAPDVTLPSEALAVEEIWQTDADSHSPDIPGEDAAVEPEEDAAADIAAESSGDTAAPEEPMIPESLADEMPVGEIHADQTNAETEEQSEVSAWDLADLDSMDDDDLETVAAPADPTVLADEGPYLGAAAALDELDAESDVAELYDAAPPALVLSEALLLTETMFEAKPPTQADEAADSLPEDLPDDLDAEIAALLADGFDASDEADEGVTEASDAAAPVGKSSRAGARNGRMRLDEADADSADGAAGVLTTGDAEVSRLLRQADDEMADADNRRRLDAIAHLKAAVAATEAERAVTGEDMNSAGAKIEPYRDDLAQVVQPPEPEPELPVRPRRKNVSVRAQDPRPGTIRPGMVGPAPLVLVSEQRIDRTPPTGQPMVAVRSGRLSGAIGAGATAPQQPRPEAARPPAAPIITAEHDDEEEDAEDNIFVDEAGFSHFAEKVGVKSMADMLEAAAAYATCMEQRDQFTRPQLMRRLIASSAGKPVSREEGLRSFGTLLRTGRIEKVSRGHYALSDNSPYLAEARRMAQ